MDPNRPHPHAELPSSQTTFEKEEERRQLRRLQIMVGMVLSVMSQDPSLSEGEARDLAANCRTAALAMFPGKELAFDLIYKPRLERVMQERFGKKLDSR
jgi:hypothetical protein